MERRGAETMVRNIEKKRTIPKNFFLRGILTYINLLNRFETWSVIRRNRCRIQAIQLWAGKKRRE